MKRFWKIFGITAGSIIGLIIIAALIAIYVIFTPERLTPIVRNVANDYITAEHEIGDVELTFFSSFPNAAIRINGLYVVNPMPEADWDTVFQSPKVIAELDLMQLLRGNLVVNGLQIEETEFWGHINKAGEANFDVLNLPKDTIEDTTAFSLPFDEMKLENIRLDINHAQLVKEPTADDLLQDSTLAPLVIRTSNSAVSLSDVEAIGNTGNADVELKLGNLLVTTFSNFSVVGDAQLSSPVNFDFDNMAFVLPKAKLSLDTLSVAYKEENYLVDATVRLLSTINAEVNANHYALQDTKLSLNEFSLDAAAEAWLRDNGDIWLDADVDIQEWNIGNVINHYLPSTIAEPLYKLNLGGIASVKAKAKGTYGESSMPVIDANISLADGELNYSAVPLELKQTDAEVEMHLDMNDSTKSVAHIKRLKTHSRQSQVDLSGDVTYLLADNMTADAKALLDLNLPDWKDLLPKEMVLNGHAKGQVAAKGIIKDFSNLNLSNSIIDGKIAIDNLDFAYDSMAAKTPKADIALRIPNNQPSKKTVGFMRAQVNLQGLEFAKANTVDAIAGSTQTIIEASNILSKDPLLKANLRLKSDRLKANTDSLQAELSAPDIKAYVVYNQKDSTAIPQVDADFSIEDIDFRMDTIAASIVEPRGFAHLSASEHNSKEPAIKAGLTVGSADAKLGQLAHIKTDNMSLNAQANKNSSKQNILLQWNPEVSVQLTNGDIAYKNSPTKIRIPNIDFDYSNQDFNISDGQVLIGKSDFTLSGEIRNIDKWLDDSGDLRGELVLYSDYTDVPEIMSLTSGIGSDDSEAEAAPADTDADPYMVPKGVHLSLNTHINKALMPFINETAYDLGGGVYVKDGVLVIEEMGFICNAAKLQLTAMYETPRRNNLFVGLDYHMLDIDLERLVDMIPQVDTVLPMLRSFRGNAEFHLAAETYLDSKYNVKWSTTRGACSIAGHDLTLIDGQTFSTVAKLLNFKNKKAENQVDSISAEITLFRKEIDVYPFLMTMDKYKAAVGGRHNLDMTCNYHVSLLAPTYLGVEISGALDDIIDKPLKHIKLEKAKYAQDFLPQYRGEVESQNQTLRQMIREALKENIEE